MRYVSTRGGMAPQTFTQILLGGLCPDGGLAVPESYPRVGEAELAAWRKLLLEHAGDVFENGSPAVEDGERRIRDLQAKVGELTMERDFLAGALGRFGLPSAKR